MLWGNKGLDLLILIVVWLFLLEVLLLLLIVGLLDILRWLLFWGVGLVMVFNGCVGGWFGEVGGELVMV